MGGELGVSAAALQVTFSLLVVLQTFCSPLQGWLVDRFGPRLLISTGRASWVLASFAGSLGMVYLREPGWGFGTSQMLRTPIFWLMFAMMTLMSTSGLMVTSQIGNFAADFGVARQLVWGLAALPLALTIDRFTNG
jgi:hypothetical protein